MIMKMIRTFHPVGQGAFYTEQFFDSLHKPFCNVVYDCGKEKSQACLDAAIDRTFNTDDKIDVLFISHFHFDHVSGIEKLFGRVGKKVKFVVVPVLSTEEQFAICFHNFLFYKLDEAQEIQNFIDNIYGEDHKDYDYKVIKIEKSSLEINEQIRPIQFDDIHEDVKLPSGIRLILDHFWLYIPHNSIDSSMHAAIELLESVKEYEPNLFKNDKLQIDKLIKIIETKASLKDLKKIYEDVFKEHNSYCMTLFSGRICNYPLLDHTTLLCSQINRDEINHKLARHNFENCMYFGDFEAQKRDYWPRFIERYKNIYSSVELVQIPHHGSQDNYHSEINENNPKLSLISAGATNGHHHPDISVIEQIKEQGAVPIQIWEKETSKIQFVYNYYWFGNYPWL